MPTMELVATDPARVGPYRLLRRLGSGGMGVVYLADTEAGGLVAVKCLPPGVSVDVRNRLHREAVYLSRVRHPRVAAFVAADTSADRPWIAMQYVAGPSLAQASVPLGPAQLRHLTEGLADALAALHRQGLTHRDVKPGNVILTHEGPVLVDLGIAYGNDLTALTAVGMVVGTPEWMAPEQLSGSGSTPAIDVWGWAAVATYAAIGRPPFGNGSIEALAHRIRHEEPDLRGTPDWLRGAVLAGLGKDPRSRPTAARLAGVDGIRAAGAVGAAGAVPGSRIPTAAAPAQSFVSPEVVPPAVARPLTFVCPPRAVVPSVREARRTRREARQRKQPTPQPTLQPTRQPRPPTRSGRRRRGPLSKLLRRLLVFALVVVAVLVVGSLVYSWVRTDFDHLSWVRAIRDLRDQVTHLFTAH